ncbi:MAG TPA: PIN/TRAM domain-containing protein [Bacillota bacterium]
MSPRLIRTVSAMAGLAGGLAVAYYFLPFLRVLPYFDVWVPVTVMVVVPLMSGLVLYLASPAVLRSIAQLTAWLESRLSTAPLSEVVVGAMGLITGLLIASLLGGALGRIPVVGTVLPTAVSILLGYLGWRVAVRHREDILSLAPLTRLAGRVSPATGGIAAKLLDTSAIIDGRIADVYETGFVEGPLIIPQFVLDELRHIADSSDPLKRNRGRRGLDVLSRLQKDLGAEVRILSDNEAGGEVDSRLVRMGQRLGARIVTNDFNLNKVAGLQGVKVLNINDLANALKPVVLPGENMEVQIMREGKEPGQGVGYLDDGTMIVVEEGKPHIGATIAVTVTSVLQTSAGRMIFARPKSLAQRAL